MNKIHVQIKDLDKLRKHFENNNLLKGLEELKQLALDL
jgi:hypothetical protein